ncbi:MAG: hypothetical protein EA353_14005 [Puniceicoccaceae bacterium]|nr:MAG: hypothetical protein EA353_14005 [Puniceicoccaceae bacterium]
MKLFFLSQSLLALAIMLIVSGCVDKDKVSNYPKQIERLKEEFVRLQVFPDQIPSSAESVYYLMDRGGMGQGALILRLGYMLPTDEFDLLVKQLEGNFAESTPSKVNRFLFGRFPLEPYDEGQLIPRDFRVFLVETELTQIRENPNHNQLCVIAVSEERRTVAYLFDSW